MKRGFSRRGSVYRVPLRVSFLLLLVSLDAHAATFSYNFNRDISQMIASPCNPIQDVHGPVTSGGITAVFGPDFSFGIDCDVLGIDCSCGNDEFGIRRWLNDYANAPSSGGVGAMCHSPYGPQGGSEDYTITFSQRVRFFSMWYSRGTPTNRIYFMYPQTTVCDSVNHPASSASLRMWNQIDVFPLAAGASLTASGSSWETGCTGDPTGHYCQWNYVELVLPPSHPGVYYVSVGTSLFDPLYIDNITASTGSCPNPPCEFERATENMRTTWGRVKAIYR